MDHALQEQLQKLPVPTFTRFNSLGRTLEGAKRACERWKKTKNPQKVAAPIRLQDRIDYMEQACKLQQEHLAHYSDEEGRKE